jgi:hypothetical protein
MTSLKVDEYGRTTPSGSVAALIHLYPGLAVLALTSRLVTHIVFDMRRLPHADPAVYKARPKNLFEAA